MAKKRLPKVKLPKVKLPRVRVPKVKVSGGKAVMDTIKDLTTIRNKKRGKR